MNFSSLIRLLVHLLIDDMSWYQFINTSSTSSTRKSQKDVLRSAEAHGGPVTVLFNVTGVVQLEGTLDVKYVKGLSLLGQQTRGRGVAVHLAPTRNNTFVLSFDRCSDLVIRHIRFRVVWRGENKMYGGVSITRSTNVVLDHLSVLFAATQDTLMLRACDNVTAQHSIFGKSVYSIFRAINEFHAGLGVYENGPDPANHTATILRNVFAFNYAGLAMNTCRGQVLGNVAHGLVNFGLGHSGDRVSQQTYDRRECGLDFIANVHYRSPLGLHNRLPLWTRQPKLESLYYVRGNIDVPVRGLGNNNDFADLPANTSAVLALESSEARLDRWWSVFNALNSPGPRSSYAGNVAPLHMRVNASQPRFTAPLAPELSSAEREAEAVLANVGPNRPALDAVDEAIVWDVGNGSGLMQSAPWAPSTAAFESLEIIDSDGDGIADADELIFWGAAVDGNATLPDEPYTFLEAYLQHLAGDRVLRPFSQPAPPLTLPGVSSLSSTQGTVDSSATTTTTTTAPVSRTLSVESPGDERADGGVRPGVIVPIVLAAVLLAMLLFGIVYWLRRRAALQENTDASQSQQQQQSNIYGSSSFASIR